MKRTFAVTFLVGAGIGLAGCQSPGLGGLALWNRSNAGLAGSTAPDVGRQRFSGLSQQLAGDSKTATGLGATKPAQSDGFLLASWKKTTAAVTGSSATTKSQIPPADDDPLRIDRVPKKIGPEVYVGAARLLENQGHFEEAEGKYHEALKAGPNDLHALVGLARLHDRTGEPQKAIEMYQRAIQAHPTSALVFNDMGLCYRRQRQLDKSMLAFRKAVDLQGDNTKYRNNLAAALVDAGRTDEAYRELARANSPAVAHYNLAYLLEQHKQHGEAARHLDEALAIDPELTPARDLLARLGRNTAPPAQAALPRQAQLKEQAAVAPYSAGAVEPSVYTSPPQVGSPVSGLPQIGSPGSSLPQGSYHLGDDAAPATETATRSRWGAAAWALPATETSSGNHPLPPVEE